jgi:hypothetical protein
MTSKCVVCLQKWKSGGRGDGRYVVAGRTALVLGCSVTLCSARCLNALNGALPVPVPRIVGTTTRDMTMVQEILVNVASTKARRMVEEGEEAKVGVSFL